MASVFDLDKATTTERAEQARLAVKNFKALIPGFNSYVRALTGRPSLKIVVSTSTNSATDGQSIFMRPPLALGDRQEHQRGLCDKIGADGFQRCPACRVREEVLSYLYHEMAHIVFGSFARVSDQHAAEITQRAIAERGTKYSKLIAERIGQLSSRQRNTYPTLSEMISPFLPLILNALEDARVNARMAESRPGTKRMAESREARVFAEGVEQVENGVPVRKFWKDYQLNLQIIVGLYVKAAGRDYKSYFAPQVVKDLSDPELAEIAAKAQGAANASDTYVLAFQALDRLRELGYCKSDSDPEDEEEEQADDEPEAEPDAGDGDGESDQPDRAEEPDYNEAPGGDDGEQESADEAGDPEAEESAGGEGSGEDAESEGEQGSESGDPSEEGTPDSDDEDGGLSGETSEGGAPDSEQEGASGGEAESDGEASPGSSEGDDDGDEVGPDSDSSGDEATTSSGTDSDDRDDAGDTGGGDPETSDEAEGDSAAGGGEGVGGERSDADTADPSSGDEPGDTDDGPSDDSKAGGDDPLDSEASDGDADESGDASSGPAGAPGDGTGAESGSDDLEGEAQASEDPLEGGSVDDQPGGGEADSSGGEMGAPGGQSDEGSGPVVDDSPEAEAEREADPRGDGDALDDGHSAEQDDLDGEEAVELFESGEGEGIEVFEYGDASEVARELARVLGHEEFSNDVTPPDEESKDEQKAVDIAIVQGEYFETPSERIVGVNEFRNGVVTRSDELQSNGWGYADLDTQRAIVQAYGVNMGHGDFAPSESIMGPALLQMRVTFADNKRNKTTAHLKSGKINAKALGKRAWGDDDRLFKRKQQPGKRSYFVMIGFDISGSQVGDNIVLTKEAVMAQAELLHRMGIPFALAAHSGSHPSEGPSVDIYWIKEPGQPWDAKAKDLFSRTQPDSSNIDGHTMEFYRKVLDKQDATDKVLMYYTDGKMPAFNATEELEILQREIKTCKAKGYALMAVGIRTDSPKEHKLETAQVNEHADIVGVVKFLQRRLAGV